MIHEPRVVLIVDDETYVRESLGEVVEAAGHEVILAADADQATEALVSGPVDIVVTDLQMPEVSGLGILERVREAGLTVPVVVITGVGTVADAVEAMKLGAYDFLQKPVDPDQLLLLIDRATRHHSLENEVSYLRAAVTDLREAGRMAGSSVAIERIRSQIGQLSGSTTTVLVSGESGTGKELVAEAIHRNSDRADGNLVSVNCAAIPESLFESEFFGHRRGAFSGAVSDRTGRFAEARGGTLVLDEISTLKTDMQAKLLRVLESGQYQVVGESRTRVTDARIIAVTNEDLAERVEEGTFRSDLYYRLAIFPIQVPPLRDRKEDIGEIAAVLLEQIASGAVPRLDPTAVGVLASYGWPGNVRELRNVLERAVIIAQGGELTGDLFRSVLELAAGGGASSDSPGSDLHLRRQLDGVEAELIRRALDRAPTKKEASALLGIDPRNLGYYLKKHGIEEDSR